MIDLEALDEARALLAEWDLHDYLDRPQKVRQLAELLAKWQAEGQACVWCKSAMRCEQDCR